MKNVFTFLFAWGLPAMLFAQLEPGPAKEKSLTEPSREVQVIELSQGWSGISSYLDPNEPAVAQLMSAIEDKLIILMDFDGSYYQPDSRNNLTEWNVKSGYFIKMSAGVSLEIEGMYPLSAQLDLQEGWNLASVLDNQPAEVETYFSGHLQDIEIITEVAGLKVYWPAKSIFTLQQLIPGRAYLVKALTAFSLFEPFSCGDTLVDSRDGKSYTTIQIGNQCWMAENLNIGTMIPAASAQTDNDTIEKYCYDNQEMWCELYGALYQWDEFMQYSTSEGVKGICPEGWHVSTYSDWITLINYLGGSEYAGIKMKSTRTDPDPHPRWDWPNMFANNESGFSALPNGSVENGTFYNEPGPAGIWWTSALQPGDIAWALFLTNSSRYHTFMLMQRSSGYSVRCILGEPWVTTPTVTTAQITDLTAHSAVSGGNVTDDGNTDVNARGVVWNTTGNPDLENNEGITFDGTGPGEFTSVLDDLLAEITYFVRAYATNSEGTAYGDELSFTTPADEFICGTSTISDVDGNIYHTIQTGDQCWMKENLKTTHYRDGTVIEYPGSNNSSWFYNSAGAYAWYENNIAWKDLYGALYNWHAVDHPAGLCPEGWHLPTHDEYTQMEQFVCNESGNADCDVKFPYDFSSTGWRGSNEGNLLKSCRQVNSPLGGDCNTDEHPRWNEHSTQYGTDEFGFSALPGGVRLPNGGYGGMGYYGYFWTATENPAYQPWSRGMQFSSSTIYRSNNDLPGYGFSVRCVRDF